MTHNQQHVIIHKLQEFAAAHPRITGFCKYLAAFVLGALVF